MKRVLWITLMMTIGCVAEEEGAPEDSGQPDASEPSAEMAGLECESAFAAALEGEPGQRSVGLFAGGFQEAQGTRDPTGGLVIAALPLADGPVYGQMVNTYLDCTGNLGTGGVYRGQRSGDVLSGTWTMRQRAGEFGGSYDGEFEDGSDMVAGSYDVSEGPTTSMECNNPDGSNHGIDGCYCASPGAFTLHRIDDGNADSEDNIPFEAEVEASGGGVSFAALDGTAQQYAVLDVDKICSDELPLVAFCPNTLGADPVELEYSDACTIAFPPSTADAVKLLTCPCLFLEEPVKGHTYVAVGINEDAGTEGVTFENIDALSFDFFVL